MFSRRYLEELEKLAKEKYKPLDFKVSHSCDDIFHFRENIGGVEFECQTSGENKQKHIEHIYAMTVWRGDQFIPMMMFLKEHEEELKAFMERYEEHV